jgi:LysR family nitrogen assimilation transcriptional regulator
MAVIFNATPSRGLSIRRLSAEAICLLHQPVDGDAGLSPIPFAQVAQYPLILPRRPHRLRQLADDAAEQCKIRLNVAYEMQSLSTILRLVEEGFGATLIAETMARRKAQEGRLVARHVVQPSMRHDIALIYLDSKPLSRAEHAVAGIMAEMVRASFPEQHAPAETAPADR